MILAAMWLSKEKPSMTTFLRLVLDSINDLYVHGKFQQLITPQDVMMHSCK